MSAEIYVKSKTLIKKNAKDMREQVVPTFKNALIEIVKSDADQKTKEDEVNRVVDKLISFLSDTENLSEIFDR
jgi:hypothetical protein